MHRRENEVSVAGASVVSGGVLPRLAGSLPWAVCAVEPPWALVAAQPWLIGWFPLRPLRFVAAKGAGTVWVVG